MSWYPWILRDITVSVQSSASSPMYRCAVGFDGFELGAVGEPVGRAGLSRTAAPGASRMRTPRLLMGTMGSEVDVDFREGTVHGGLCPHQIFRCTRQQAVPEISTPNVRIIFLFFFLLGPSLWCRDIYVCVTHRDRWVSS